MGLTISWSTEKTFRSSDGGDLLEEATEYLTLDLLEAEDLSYAGLLTNKPIESESFVSDHFRREPTSVRCQCVHTDIPPLDKELDYSLTSVSIGETEVTMGALNGAYGDNSFTTIDRSRRITDMASVLEELFETGTEVLLEGVGVFNKTWVITSLDFSRTPETSGALSLGVTFTEVRKSFIEETEAPTIERARRRRDTGRVSPSESTEEEETEVRTSVENNTNPNVNNRPPRQSQPEASRPSRPTMSVGRVIRGS